MTAKKGILHQCAMQNDDRKMGSQPWDSKVKDLYDDFLLSSRVLLATKSYQDWWSSWIFTHFQDSFFVISLLKKSANSSVLNLESFCIFCCTDKFMMFCQQSWKEQKWNCWPSKKMNWFICGVNCCRLVYTLVLLQVSELKLDDLRPCKVKKDEKWCQYSN